MKDGVTLVPIRLGTFHTVKYLQKIESVRVRINAYFGEEKLEPCGVVERIVNGIPLRRSLKGVLEGIGDTLNTNGEMLNI